MTQDEELAFVKATLRAAGIDPTGRLQVRPGGSDHVVAVAAGDVVHLRPASSGGNRHGAG